MQISVHIGLLYFAETLKLLISTVLVLNMFLVKSKNSSQTSKQTFLEYKQVIQKCVGTFALDSLILCLQINN